MASAREVIDRHVAAFGAKDPDAEPWSEDAEMVTPAGRFEGRDQVLGFLKVFWDALPDARLEITRSIEDGALAAAEGMLTGTQTGCPSDTGRRNPAYRPARGTSLDGDVRSARRPARL